MGTYNFTEHEQAALSPYIRARDDIERQIVLVLTGIVAAREIKGNVKLSADGTHILIEEPPQGGTE